MKRTTVLLLTAPILLVAGCSGGPGPDTNAGSASTTAPVTASPTTRPPTAAASSVPTAARPSGLKPVSSRCHTNDLALKPGEHEGAAGTEYLALVFTNTSSRTCTLYGYPGVSWVAGNQGAQVGDPFQRDRTHEKVTVTLAPGQAAHANLQMPNPGNYDDARCKPMSVWGLRVYPPDETAAVLVKMPSKQCSAKGVDVDTVWAISAGTHP